MSRPPPTKRLSTPLADWVETDHLGSIEHQAAAIRRPAQIVHPFSRQVKHCPTRRFSGEMTRPSPMLTASHSSRIERAASYAFAGRPAALPRESQLTLSWGT